jgi:hypothetical protein
VQISSCVRNYRTHSGQCKRRILAVQHAPAEAFACEHFGSLFVERLMARCVWGPQGSEKLPWSGPPARWLRIVYNFRDDTELEGSTLIGTGPDVYAKKVWRLLILIALLVTVSYLTGCGGAGSGSSSQLSEEQQESRSAGTTRPEDEEYSGGRLGPPALGDADAPVVLTEYSDYQ